MGTHVHDFWGNMDCRLYTLRDLRGPLCLELRTLKAWPQSLNLNMYLSAPLPTTLRRPQMAVPNLGNPDIDSSSHGDCEVVLLED